MSASEFEKIARELLDLLDLQVAVVVGRRFDELGQEELDAYESRKRRIAKLRSALQALLPSGQV